MAAVVALGAAGAVAFRWTRPPRLGEGGEVPPGLLALERGAEDAYAHALEERRGALGEDSAKVADAWNSQRAQLADMGLTDLQLTAMDAAVRDFQRAVGARAGALELARAANALAAPMDGFFRPFLPRAPAGLLTLEYAAREQVLDARAKDLARARRSQAALARAWAELCARAPQAAGSRAGRDFEAGLAQLRAAIDAGDVAALEAAAQRALAHAGALERELAQ
ncbi:MULTISPECIES: hypothetical protein [Myxococcaceae]|uniref:hypothetical protein n=1 Tax=Myxococcaceae TaxID=31 RepID=UPI00188E4451|nr:MULTISPECIES: hypothetical protein [Myxococcaceae]MBF5045932.1 hypothetical protein [Simulacricoccus sp. 17bor-14]